jgi:mannose/fructose-specific phosphotransferase system component IIA
MSEAKKLANALMVAHGKLAAAARQTWSHVHGLSASGTAEIAGTVVSARNWTAMATAPLCARGAIPTR